MMHVCITVTLKHICVIIFAWKSIKYYTIRVCVCSLSYPACNVHASYCHLWTVWLYNIFPHYLINDMIKKKKV